MIGRRTEVEIKFHHEGKVYDATEDISPFLISLSWTDNMSDKADDLTITLDDLTGIWRESWLPDTEGYILEVGIKNIERIYEESEAENHNIGKFEIDEVVCKPDTVQIKAVSIIGNSSLRNKKYSQTWEKFSLKNIAEEIAKRNELKLFFDCDENPNIDHVEQDEQADLEFLQKLCHDNGLALKITPEQLIIFDEYKFEQVEPMIGVWRPGFDGNYGVDKIRLTWLTDWQLKQKSRDIYDACEIQNAKWNKKEVITSVVDKKGRKREKKKTVKEKEVVKIEYDIGSKEKVLRIKQQVKDEQEAERLARRKLRDANKDRVTGTFSTIGNLNLKASNTLEFYGFGKFDGRYIITKASHTINDSNFKTSVDVRKCLIGY